MMSAAVKDNIAFLNHIISYKSQLVTNRISAMQIVPVLSYPIANQEVKSHSLDIFPLDIGFKAFLIKNGFGLVQ